MGLADLPRAYFRGFTYWSPSTMNNNDYQPTYDPATATLTWPWLERHGVDAQRDFDRFATHPGVLPLGNDVVNVIESARPPALWNFYGDNSCGFVQPDEPVIEWPGKFGKPAGETKVIAYTNTNGNRIGEGDPWIGLPVALNTRKGSSQTGRRGPGVPLEFPDLRRLAPARHRKSWDSRGRPPGGLTRGGSSCSGTSRRTSSLRASGPQCGRSPSRPSISRSRAPLLPALSRPSSRRRCGSPTSGA